MVLDNTERIAVNANMLKQRVDSEISFSRHWLIAIGRHEILIYSSCSYNFFLKKWKKIILLVYVSINGLLSIVARAHDFSVAKFDERTVMLCDQVSLHLSSPPKYFFISVCFFQLILKFSFLSSVRKSIMLVACGTLGYVT